MRRGSLCHSKRIDQLFLLLCWGIERDSSVQHSFAEKDHHHLAARCNLHNFPIQETNLSKKKKNQMSNSVSIFKVLPCTVFPNPNINISIYTCSLIFRYNCKQNVCCLLSVKEVFKILTRLGILITVSRFHVLQFSNVCYIPQYSDTMKS